MGFVYVKITMSLYSLCQVNTLHTSDVASDACAILTEI